MTARRAAQDGRRNGKGALRDALAALTGLTATGAAGAAGVSRQLLSLYGRDEADNLPSADVLRRVADYLDDGGARLRQLARKLRTQAATIDRRAGT